MDGSASYLVAILTPNAMYGTHPHSMAVRACDLVWLRGMGEARPWGWTGSNPRYGYAPTRLIT